jgi:hypothetical protein
VAKTTGAHEAVDDGALLELFRAIAARDDVEIARRLDTSPALARASLHTGASRDEAEEYFLVAIRHYAYADDTALHIAAAAHRRDVAAKLIGHGADVRARNRRGAQPLHYAADGHPDSPGWNPGAQAATIAALVTGGADPNARDKSGVAPLHRAVRTRCAAAVAALLEGGADPGLPNLHGSTPRELATQTTGRGGSGSDAAKAQQAEILRLLP